MGDQTANQTAKCLKKCKKRKKNHQFWNSRINCSDVSPLASSPVCLCLLGGFEALLRWSAKWGPGGAGIWQACKAGAWWEPKGQGPSRT
jgi:hypothetical protein